MTVTRDPRRVILCRPRPRPSRCANHEFIVNVVPVRRPPRSFAEVADSARGVIAVLGLDAATYVDFPCEANAARPYASG
jgi:hypothetical protein